MRLHTKIGEIDLNFDLLPWHARPAWRAWHEQRTNHLRSVARPSSHERIPGVRRAISRRSSHQDLLLLGSVSVHDLCTTFLPRKPARYCRLPAIPESAALSYGF